MNNLGAAVYIIA